MAFFVFPDLVRLLQCQADIVQTVHQAILAERVNRESERDGSVIVSDDHFFQIDRQLITRIRFNGRKQLLDLFFRQGNRS